MKEMIYSKEGKSEVLLDGIYRGVRYLIVNRGIHPCCYIETYQDFLNKRKNPDWGDIEGLWVHGGVTLSGEINKTQGCQDIEGLWIGWDYGHLGDWAGYLSDEDNLKYGNRKYTTEMLESDCMNAIDQYLEIEKGDTTDDAEIAIAEGFIRQTETWKRSEAFQYALERLKESDLERYRVALMMEIAAAGFTEKYDEMLKTYKK